MKTTKTQEVLTMNLLEVKSLSKTYGSGNTAVHALKNVSFCLHFSGFPRRE